MEINTPCPRSRSDTPRTAGGKAFPVRAEEVLGDCNTRGGKLFAALRRLTDFFDTLSRATLAGRPAFIYVCQPTRGSRVRLRGLRGAVRLRPAAPEGPVGSVPSLRAPDGSVPVAPEVGEVDGATDGVVAGVVAGGVVGGTVAGLVGAVVGLTVGITVGSGAFGLRQPAKSASVRTATAARILYFFMISLLIFLSSAILFPEDGHLDRERYPNKANAGRS